MDIRLQETFSQMDDFVVVHSMAAFAKVSFRSKWLQFLGMNFQLKHLIYRSLERLGEVRAGVFQHCAVTIIRCALLRKTFLVLAGSILRVSILAIYQYH